MMNRAMFGWLVAMLSLAMICSGVHASGTNVTIDGYKVLVNGEAFKFKGMNYSPVPIGTTPGADPYGDYFTSAYSNVWEYDINLMRQMGVNTIKLYAGNPGANAGAAGTGGNWAAFLDELWNGGDQPIRVMMTSYVQGQNIAAGGSEFETYKTQWQAMVASTASHPAVLGYTVGNEIYNTDVNTNPQFWQNMGELVDLVRSTAEAQAPDDRKLITTAINDALTSTTFGNTWQPIVEGEQSGHMGNLDAWAINIYRGAHLGGEGNDPFAQYAQLMQDLGVTKPMILGEFGIPHSTRPDGIYGTTDTTNPIDLGNGQSWVTAAPDNGDPAAFMQTMLQTIAAHMGGTPDHIAVGGYVFSFVDEYWKGNDPDNHLGGPSGNFMGDAFPGGYWDEAWFGLTSAIHESDYDGTTPITRDLFAAFHAVSDYYNSFSHFGGEAYFIPEPGSLMLLGAGGILVLMRRRRGA